VEDAHEDHAGAPFGALLRRHRVAAGLTQEALAERAGISARAVSDLERGLYRAPHRDTVDRLGRGHLGEGRRWLEELLARTSAPTVGRVRALLGAGGLARFCGDPPAARAWLEEGLALARRVGDRRYVAWLLRDLGQLCLFSLCDYPRARALLEEGLALARGLGDGRAAAVVLGNLAALARWEGDYASARAFLEEALPLARAAGDRFALASALVGSARQAAIEGEFGRAEAAAGEALAVAEALGAAVLVAAAWADGQAMTRERAVAYALSDGAD
jgi:transcriptional regulator with XRE-family HTH domain